MLKIIRYHSQSIFLLLIAMVLLAGAFLITRLTRANYENPGLTHTPQVKGNVLSEIPDCSIEDTLAKKIACYSEAERISEALVLSAADELLSIETLTGRRIEFIESQTLWKESRNMECSFARGVKVDTMVGELRELTCLTELNLARLERLEGYLCDWYQVGCQ